MRLNRYLLVLPSLLAACAASPDRTKDFDIRAAPQRCKVTVHVSDTSEVVVDHEPPHTKGCTGKSINWFLNGGDWAFRSGDGIAFSDPQSVLARNCEPVGRAGKQINCTFAGAPTGKRHKYTINIVRKHSAGEDVELLDPYIFND